MFNVQPTPYDLCFRFLGFPVRVHPFFWLIIALLGMRGDVGNMQVWIMQLITWIAAAFLSILVHEVGHALVFRHVLGVHSKIVFYGLGGMTIPTTQHRRTYGFHGMLREVFLSFAGPLAGFLLAAFIILCFVLAGTMQFGLSLSVESATQSLLNFSPEFFLMTAGINGINVKFFVVLFLFQVVLVSIFWGVFNLLPIFPMDGGQISREIFSYFSPRRGVANSLGLSIVVAICIGILALKSGMFFIAVLFGFFAFQNYQELTFRSSGYR